MTPFIVGDHPTLVVRLRKALSALGQECSPSCPLTVDQAIASPPSTAEEPALLFFAMSADMEKNYQGLRNIRAASTAKIVVVGPVHDSYAVLEALQAGADYFVDEEKPLEKELARAIARLSAPTRNESLGRLITITAASGGAGCTFLSANLGIALAQRTKSCGLLDFASGFGSLCDHLNLQARHTLNDVIRNVDALDRDVLSQSLTPHPGGLSLLASGPDHDELNSASAETLDRIVLMSLQVLSNCVLDIDHHVTRRCHALQHSTSIVLVFRLDFASLCETRRLLDDWDRRRIDMSRVLFVANRCGQPVELPVDKVQSVLGRNVSLCIPDDPVVAGLSVNCGNPAVLEAPTSRLAAAIQELAGRLVPEESGKSNTADGHLPGNGSHGQSHAWLQRAASMLFPLC